MLVGTNVMFQDSLRVLVVDFVFGQGDLGILLQVGPDPDDCQLDLRPRAQRVDGPGKRDRN